MITYVKFDLCNGVNNNGVAVLNKGDEYSPTKPGYFYYVLVKRQIKTQADFHRIHVSDYMSYQDQNFVKFDPATRQAQDPTTRKAQDLSTRKNHKAHKETTKATGNRGGVRKVFCLVPCCRKHKSSRKISQICSNQKNWVSACYE